MTTFVNTLLLVLLSGITFILSLIHFYWALGGKKGITSVVPKKPDGTPLFQVGWFSCTVVGIGLLMCSASYILFPIYHSVWNRSTAFASHPNASDWLLFALIAVFLLRAIGDFKYVGFFKSVRNTDFGRLDSKYFSPLCLLLGLGSLALYFLTH